MRMLMLLLGIGFGLVISLDCACVAMNKVSLLIKVACQMTPFVVDKVPQPEFLVIAAFIYLVALIRWLVVQYQSLWESILTFPLLAFFLCLASIPLEELIKVSASVN